MTAPHIVDPAGLLGEALAEASPDLLRSLLQTIINALLSADADAVVGAEYGRPSADRLTQRNGYRHRPMDTRVGTIDVAIPKLRRGSYFPEWLLERRKRAESALITVVADCYLASGLDPPDGQARQDPGHRFTVEVAGVPDGRRAGSGRRRVPAPAPGRRRAVHVRGRRRVDDESA